MGLTSQLIPALICLLACTSNFTHGRKYITLQETIKMLNVLTAKKDPRCMELTVSDVLAAPKNTTEKETLCRAATVLRQVYRHHKCLTRILSGLDRNLSSMANKTSCPVNEAKKRTLKDFLERLKTIMQEKYSKSGSWIF
ncbi:interleukin-4 [Myotis myotis]|uniref:Interleukin-4 n=1 Tax=Myotis myotis TaxID=51298 RepID=A0A7J7XHQ6_MYOMY|nr:interleukin-4 [Myotis myotis]KAF6348830.1 interleukin 4 [Myotis myotis]